MNISNEYIAGFFDGEGCVSVYSNGHGAFCLRTQLTQNKTIESKEIMTYLQNRFGGNIGEQITLSKKLKYNWQLSCEKAASFLRIILPLLILKKKQAQLAIEWIEKKPLQRRDSRGRIMAWDIAFKEYSLNVSNTLKKYKKDYLT